MAVAGAGLDRDGVGSILTERPGPAAGTWIAAAVALAFHAALGAMMIRVNPARFHAETPVEIDVQEPPPPELKPPAPEPPPPPPEPRPRVALRRAPVAPREPTPPAAPPPPNQEQPPPSEQAPPTFGVSMSSVVAGNASGVAVPVGNTLMANPASKRAAQVKPYGGEGTRPFTPVAEMYVAKYPEKVFEVNSEDVYPADAKRMGIEGVVRFKIGIDEKGNVADVKLVERAGHGFDEAATKVMWKLKFKPAIANDGRPVPFRIDYAYRFDLAQ
jgi:protein TonB